MCNIMWAIITFMARIIGMNGNFGFQSIIPEFLKIGKEVPEIIHVSIDKK